MFYIKLHIVILTILFAGIIFVKMK